MTARILVVDDVAPNVKLLEAKLTREYYEVVTASSGPDALAKVEQVKPDVILLDVMMPGMDGFEVCRRLKASPTTRHIPVVMVTALSDSSDRVRGLECGADDFLTKPVNDIALFARVRAIMRLKMIMDELLSREQTSEELGVSDSEVSEFDQPVNRATILVVDDSALERERIGSTLQRDEHRIVAVASVADALGETRKGEFDLVCISSMLASEDGLRLVSQLRSAEATRYTPIILLSDEADMQRIAKGLELGANDYVVKPIDRNELLARVRIQIRRRRFLARLRENFERSLSLALTDSLTGLFNRRYLTAHLARLIGRLGTTPRQPVSIVLIDIDHFKAVNDQLGHAAGDDVLKAVARRLSGRLRATDTVARYGGEEFVVVLPDSPLETAAAVAERLRRAVAEAPVSLSDGSGTVPVTISLGVASTEDPEDMPGDLLRRADAALYEAKRRGRDRVVAAGLDMPLMISGGSIPATGTAGR